MSIFILIDNREYVCYIIYTPIEKEDDNMNNVSRLETDMMVLFLHTQSEVKPVSMLYTFDFEAARKVSQAVSERTEFWTTLEFVEVLPEIANIQFNEEDVIFTLVGFDKDMKQTDLGFTTDELQAQFIKTTLLNSKEYTSVYITPALILDDELYFSEEVIF